MVGYKWVFTIKYKTDGSIERLKSQINSEFTQTYRADYQETFAPVAKLNTIIILLSCAAKLECDL
ncbi:Cysteine-rich RLK (receptor-like protein kinase) 8 [Gossypium australe]|uniref:Cysteine-rich RLK (Receptor-like protein kinase) 8 n=1 Tax=Gossypium australe TaxID=47621 RepID=A0A5B6WT79_9ROSI|nr:Cysteine-rich RLK (receptor-like protein kinase) 8 [Gossypium australe]